MPEAKSFFRRFTDAKYLTEGAVASVQTAIDAETGDRVVIKTANSLQNNLQILREAEVMNKLQGVGFPRLIFQDRSSLDRARLVVSFERGSKFNDDELKNWDEQTEHGRGQLQLRLLMMRSYGDRIKTAWSKGILLTDYKSDAFVLDLLDRKGIVVVDLNVTKDVPSKLDIPDGVDETLQDVMKTAYKNDGELRRLITQAEGALGFRKNARIVFDIANGAKEYKAILRELESASGYSVTAEKRLAAYQKINGLARAYYNVLKSGLDAEANKAKVADFFEFVEGIVNPIFGARVRSAYTNRDDNFKYEDLLDKIPRELHSLRGWVVDRLETATRGRTKSEELLASFNRATENDVQSMGGEVKYWFKFQE